MAVRPSSGGLERPLFSVVNRRTLPEEIANRILDLIRDEHLRPGDKLPPERELASSMGVSRPVLREALRALAIMKVVSIRQGSGTYVTALEPEQLVSHVEFIFSKDPAVLAQVLEARRIIEVGNARLAAERISPEKVAELEALVERLGSAVGDADLFSTLDIAFHDAVCSAAGNPMLTQFMAILNTLAKISRERTGRGRGVREVTLQQHGRILDAVRAHDPDAAAAAMRDHLLEVERALERPGAHVHRESR